MCKKARKHSESEATLLVGFTCNMQGGGRETPPKHQVTNTLHSISIYPALPIRNASAFYSDPKFSWRMWTTVHHSGQTVICTPRNRIMERSAPAKLSSPNIKPLALLKLIRRRFGFGTQAYFLPITYGTHCHRRQHHSATSFHVGF